MSINLKTPEACPPAGGSLNSTKGYWRIIKMFALGLIIGFLAGFFLGGVIAVVSAANWEDITGFFSGK